MKTLYFDCLAGASGDMILGGLIALGIDVADLERELAALDAGDFEIRTETTDRAGISAIHASVSVADAHGHRHLRDIVKIIQDSSLSDVVKARATGIFTRIAAAEANVHAIDVRDVHFHEVGAMDAIIDIVGACIGFELLGIERFICSKVHVGSGFVQMAHGKYPVPPPAVAELLVGIPIFSTEIEGELVTPTGAAIISFLCDAYGALPEMKVESIGYGAGTRKYESFPNVLRLMLGETSTESPFDRRLSDDLLIDNLVLMETNLDDVSPQVLGYVMERSLELGAMDCWFTPIQMKKNRPATLLTILCSVADQDALTALLYSETPTLGIRSTNVERSSLRREIVSVQTEYGPANVKIARLAGKIVNVMPEYEDVRRLAIQNGVAFRIAHSCVMLAFKGLSISAVSQN